MISDFVMAALAVLGMLVVALLAIVPTALQFEDASPLTPEAAGAVGPGPAR
jgi:hypothetical protein